MWLYPPHFLLSDGGLKGSIEFPHTTGSYATLSDLLLTPSGELLGIVGRKVLRFH